jgi:uncharacterized protein
MPAPKYIALQQVLNKIGSCLVAYSGGVDSTFLLRVAVDTLGPDKVVALIANSPTYQDRFFEQARQFVQECHIRYVTIDTHELDNEEFCANPPNRCYYCKHELFSECRKFAEQFGMAAVLDGSNADDARDYRPGMQAKKELAIRSPLLEVGLTKAEIRQLSRELNLPTWNKPATVCLASRFPYGTAITPERLTRIDRCENVLIQLGFQEFRVRDHEPIARIEVAVADFPKLLDATVRQQLLTALKQAGFRYITLDLEGYRTGSMNEILTEKSED